MQRVNIMTQSESVYKVIQSNITPCLWFNGQAEEAARYYSSLFPDSHVDSIQKSPGDFPNGKKGDTLAVEFTLMGRTFTALNGGPLFKFSEAISFQVPCKSQAEVDKYWSALSSVPQAEACGWCKDRFGVSWQIVPTRLYELLSLKDPVRAGRVMEAMLKMKKLDLNVLENASV